MLAYKGFEKGLVCRKYKFSAGVKSVTKEANCARNGFHAAENPLDTFHYYPDIENSEYWIVKCEGDIHEDGKDSRIACTELTPIRRLSIAEMVAASLIYMQKYPMRELVSISKNSHFKIARGNNPVLSGENGQVIGFAKTRRGKTQEINLIFIDGVQYLPNVRYDIEGNIVE